MGAGTQIKALDDRLYVQALVTNGNESQFANAQMDDLPGFNVGGWYDFGGTWNDARKRWDLYGDSISDIDYSCNPVLRVGGAANIVPDGPQSEYDTDELSRIRTSTAGARRHHAHRAAERRRPRRHRHDRRQRLLPRRRRFVHLRGLLGRKWRGFSLYNGYWIRDLDNFRGVREATGPGTAAYPGNGINNAILYTVNTSPTATTRGPVPGQPRADRFRHAAPGRLLRHPQEAGTVPPASRSSAATAATSTATTAWPPRRRRPLGRRPAPRSS